MNALDWAIVTVMLLSVLLAAAQGFLHEIIALAGVVLGYLLAAWEYGRVAAWTGEYVRSEPVAEGLAFLGIFFGVVIAAGMIGRIVHWLAKAAGLGWADRFLGAAFGVLRGYVIAAVLVLALAAFVPGSRTLMQSSLAGYFLVGSRGMSWVAPASLRQKLREGIATLGKAAAPPKNQR